MNRSTISTGDIQKEYNHILLFCMMFGLILPVSLSLLVAKWLSPTLASADSPDVSLFNASHCAYIRSVCGFSGVSTLILHAAYWAAPETWKTTIVHAIIIVASWTVFRIYTGRRRLEQGDLPEPAILPK